MNEDTGHQCETQCGRPAPNTYICWDCVDDLRHQLDTFTPEDHAGLLAIARRQETPATPRAASPGPAPKAGPGAPVNLAALDLHDNITRLWPALLDTLPHQPDAARTWHDIRTRLDVARVMLHGETPLWDEDQQAALLADIPPMQTRHLVPWMRENVGVRVTPERIKKWGQRGVIRPAPATGGHPAYHPSEIMRALAEHGH